MSVGQTPLVRESAQPPVAGGGGGQQHPPTCPICGVYPLAVGLQHCQVCTLFNRLRLAIFGGPLLQQESQFVCHILGQSYLRLVTHGEALVNGIEPLERTAQYQLLFAEEGTKVEKGKKSKRKSRSRSKKREKDTRGRAKKEKKRKESEGEGDRTRPAEGSKEPAGASLRAGVEVEEVSEVEKPPLERRQRSGGPTAPLTPEWSPPAQRETAHTEEPREIGASGRWGRTWREQRDRREFDRAWRSERPHLKNKGVKKRERQRSFQELRERDAS